MLLAAQAWWLWQVLVSRNLRTTIGSESWYSQCLSKLNIVALSGPVSREVLHALDSQGMRR